METFSVLPDEEEEIPRKISAELSINPKKLLKELEIGIQKLKNYSENHPAPFESIEYEFRKLDDKDEGIISYKAFYDGLDGLGIGLTSIQLQYFISIIAVDN